MISAMLQNELEMPSDIVGLPELAAPASNLSSGENANTELMKGENLRVKATLVIRSEYRAFWDIFTKG
jgi:hypothetical protein